MEITSDAILSRADKVAIIVSSEKIEMLFQAISEFLVSYGPVVVGYIF
jgi:hypothetical protein